MYIIYNNDGSINKFDLSDFIQKGNNGVNSIFLAIKGRDYHEWSAGVLFTLPNDDIEVVTPLSASQEIDGVLYSGWLVSITSGVTAYAGNVTFSVQIINLQNQVLFTYEGKLVINPSSIVPDDLRITLSQYNALLQLVLQTPTSLTTIKVLNNVLTEDLSAYGEGQIFLSRADHNFYILQSGLVRVFDLDYITSDSLASTLNNYVTSQNLSSILASYVTSSGLATTLSNYVTSSSLASTLSGYVTSSNLTSILSDYITSSSLASTLGGYVTTSGLTSTLGDYVKTSVLNSTLANYVTSSSLASTLASYVTSSGLTSILSGYVTSTYLNTVLAGYLTSSDLNGYATESFVNSALSNYITSSDLSTALNGYATQTWVNNNLSSYVTSTALNNTLSNYVTSTQMQNAIATALSSALEYKGKASVSTLNGYGTSSSNGSLYVLTDAGTLTQGNVSVIAGDQVAWNSSTSQWDKLAAAIDTSNFVTTSDLNTALGDYVLTSALSSALANYVTSSSLSSTLASYVTSSSLSSTLANYVTTTALNTALASYVTTTALNTALSDYATTSDLNTAIADFITSSDLSTALASYVTASSLASTLASYVTSSSLASTLSSYVTSSGLATTLSNYVTTSALASALTSYVTSSTLASTLAGYVQAEAGKGLSSNDYTTADQTKLSGIESGAQVNVLEGISINGVTLPISGKIASITGLATNSYVDGKVNKLEPIDISSLTLYDFINTYGLGTTILGKITYSYHGQVTDLYRVYITGLNLYSNTHEYTVYFALTNTYSITYKIQTTGPWSDNQSALSETFATILARSGTGTITVVNGLSIALYRHVVTISASNLSTYFTGASFRFNASTTAFTTLNSIPSTGEMTLVIESTVSTTIKTLNNLNSVLESTGGKLRYITQDGYKFQNPTYINTGRIMYDYVFPDSDADITYQKRVYRVKSSVTTSTTLFSDTVTQIGFFNQKV